LQHMKSLRQNSSVPNSFGKLIALLYVFFCMGHKATFKYYFTKANYSANLLNNLLRGHVFFLHVEAQAL
jgi:hypothetical protein